MEAYLDNSATTRCFPEVTELMVKVLTEDYGNASSMHMKGVEAEKYVKDAAKAVAKTLRCKEKEIIFTSGGTESNNMAILGVAMANRRKGKHIITTAVEHPSVKNVVRFLEKEGFEITYLPVNEYGEVSVEQTADMIREDTILVSVMMVNNEIGALEPIEALGHMIKEKNPDTIFHVDAIQAYGKFRIVPKQMGIDLLSVSGHKIHGPKGIGFLYVKDKTKIVPINYGGGQQKGMRNGTINVPGIAGLGKAAELIYGNFDSQIQHMYHLKTYMAERLMQLDEVTVNGRIDEKSAPHVISASFSGVRSEVLLHSLEDRGIYVSAGSACSSHHPADSTTLEQIGLDPKLQESTLRFSFCIDTTKEELDYTIEVLSELLPMLRRYTRR